MNKNLTKLVSWLEVKLGNTFPNVMTYVRKLIGYGFEPEQKLVNRFVGKNSNVLDIGANAGSYIDVFLGLGCNVFAFEPNPLYIKRLKKKYRNKISLFECALSNTTGVSELRVPCGINGAGTLSTDNNFGGAYEKSDVRSYYIECKRLDDIDLPEIHFIKIDVEGFEREVLAGGLKTIVSSMPIMLIEIEERHRQGSIMETRLLLQSLGYSMFFQVNGKFTPIELFDVDVHQKDVSRPDYINNFFFIPETKINFLH